MIIQKIYLGTYDWHITVFYETDSDDASYIIDALLNAGCSQSYIKRAEDNIMSDERNTGLTFSNYKERESVVVLSKTTTEDEFANTWFHEVIHVAVHIGEADGIPCDTEYVAYVGGNVAMRMQPSASRYMCSKCRCHEKS